MVTTPPFPQGGREGYCFVKQECFGLTLATTLPFKAQKVSTLLDIHIEFNPFNLLGLSYLKLNVPAPGHGKIHLGLVFIPL